MFELLDDYFTSPLTGIFVCDQQGRILAFGKGAQEMCGFRELDLMGLDLAESLGLATPEEPDAQQPHKTALEWGARVLGKPMTLHTSSDMIVPVTGDFFPALDDDGGLLAAFTPRGGN
ncbi:MAG: PAS domain-containing protein [Thermoleophilia bacterium]|nr:PAS domain-containing protein [Thermoleophilia bacterium]